MRYVWPLVDAEPLASQYYRAPTPKGGPIECGRWPRPIKN